MLFVALASATIASAIKTSPAALRQFGALSTHGVAATRFADANDAYALLEPIRDAFDELRSVHPDALAPQLEPPAPGTTLHAKDAKFHCYAAGTTRAMRWLYAADESTLELFEPLAAHFRPHFDMTVSAAGWDGDDDGAPLTVLSAASFVAVVGADEGISDEIARWHEDWGACGDHEAFSVLLPMHHVTHTAQKAYRLEYRTWENDRVNVYDYQLGDAVLVDGRAPHRTAPFSAADLEQADGVRVLVCLNFASTDPAARDGQLDTMRRQTPNFFHLPH